MALRWPGLISNADPLDLPPGAATVQENVMSLVPGSLQPRRGLRPFTFASTALSGSGASLGMFRFMTAAREYAIFMGSNGTVFAGRVGQPVRSIESKVSILATPCWTQNRKGWLARVNGLARGTLWKEATDKLYYLGITAPVAAPGIVAAAGGGSWGGTYYCAYRYVDVDGVCSSISPLATVTAVKDNKFTWTVVPSAELRPSSSPVRATKIQLFRSTLDQEITLYLVAEIDNTATSAVDTLTDDALMAKMALPILYSDGSLSANRFEPPPADMGVVVQFQDRWFYSVYLGSDSNRRNLLLYSERNEMESVPPTQNALILADDATDNDQITGLVPYGAALYILKTRHVYRLTFAVDPRLDGESSPVTTRGAMNQHCWGLYNDVAFLLDQIGPWAMTTGGGITEVGNSIRNYFRDGTVDFEKFGKFFVSVEPNQAVVRFHVAFTGDDGDQPKRAFAYSVENNAWWLETYPWGLGYSCRFEKEGRVRTIVGGPSGYLLLLADGYADSLTAGQNNLPIAWTYKSGMIPLPPVPIPVPPAPLEVRNNQITVSFEPTPGASTFNVAVYYDHETTPDVLFPYAEGPCSAAYGAAKFTVNMQTTQSSFSRESGYARIPVKARADARAISNRYVTVELSGSQQTDEQVIHSVSLGEGG